MDNVTNVLIVDDEPLGRERIARLLSRQERTFRLAEAENGIEAVDAIVKQKPDVVFLDIQMPGLDGFEVLQHLPEKNFQIVFQTAYDRFALRAFDENACDYLLKPFSEERFGEALDRALKRVQAESTLANLEATLRRHDRWIKTLVVKQGNAIKVVPCDEILYFMSRDHLTYVHTASGEYITDLTIKHLAERLPPTFIRLHRSSIARVTEIASVTKGGKMVVKLKNGVKIPVARSCRSRVREAIASMDLPERR